jgi:hypothetical protein
MGKEKVGFNSGADRESMQMGIEERFKEKSSLMLKGGGAANGLTFEAQRDNGTDFFSYGATRKGAANGGDGKFQGGSLDDTVREGNTTGSYGKGEPIRNDIKDASNQAGVTIYRDGPDGRVADMKGDRTSIIQNFMDDTGAKGTAGFRIGVDRGNFATAMPAENKEPTEYNASKTVFRKSQSSGGYTVPGVDSSLGKGPGSNFMADSPTAGVKVTGFTRRFDDGLRLTYSDYGGGNPSTVTGDVADASAFRRKMDTNKYENSFAGAEISSEVNNGRGVL